MMPEVWPELGSIGPEKSKLLRQQIHSYSYFQKFLQVLNFEAGPHLVIDQSHDLLLCKGQEFHPINLLDYKINEISSSINLDKDYLLNKVVHQVQVGALVDLQEGGDILD